MVGRSKTCRRRQMLTTTYPDRPSHHPPTAFRRTILGMHTVIIIPRLLKKIRGESELWVMGNHVSVSAVMSDQITDTHLSLPTHHCRSDRNRTW